jgi:drug/metabolite transporter (DMT)-like permease
MDDPSASTPVRLPALMAGFTAIYLIWGSTFLGIKFAVETLPPFLMAGSRFALPGLVLLFWLRSRGARPSARQWRLAVLTGGLLLVGGNGLVTWGQQQLVPSGRAALLIATTPVWMALLGWLFYGTQRPGLRMTVGMVAGFVGAALLIKAPTGADNGSLVGYLAILFSPVVWTLGSLHTRHARIAEDALLVSAMQMVAGGVLMLLVGSLLGEWPQLAGRTISLRSVLAFAYLAIFGALVGFSTYAWLLRVASPTAVATYAYVNPLIAVLLGWLFNNETLDQTVLLAGALIIGAVLVLTLPVTVRPSVVVDDEGGKSLPEPCPDGYTQEELTANAG